MRHFRKHLFRLRSCIKILPRFSMQMNLFAVVTTLATLQSVSAQGLLGKRYVEGGFQTERFNDGIAKNWIYDFSLTSNLPLSETWDFQANLDFVWFQDDFFLNSAPINFEFDATSISAGLRKHFRPQAKIDPFAGIGMRYANVTSLTAEPSITFIRHDHYTFVDFSAGFEWKVSDRLAYRPQVVSGDTFKDFDIEEVLTDNINFEMPMIFWWNENWFSTFTFATDFDDSDYGLRFTIGYGDW